MKTRLVLSLIAAATTLGVSACTTPGQPESELTQEQVCLAHFENDPVERDRCRMDASVRGDTPPDVAPMQLPIRNGQMGD